MKRPSHRLGGNICNMYIWWRLTEYVKTTNSKKKRAGNPIEKWLGQALQKREYPNGQ